MRDWTGILVKLEHEIISVCLNNNRQQNTYRFANEIQGSLLFFLYDLITMHMKQQT